MNFTQRRTVFSVLLAMAMTFMVTAGRISAAETDSGSPATGELKTLAVISIASYDDLWKMVERVATPIGYGKNIAGVRTAFGEVEGLDQKKPGGLIVTTDGKDIYPVWFLPIPNWEDLQFVSSDDIKKGIKKEDGRLFMDRGASDPLELVQRNGTLILFPKDKAKFVPQGDLAGYLGSLNKEFVLGLKVNLNNLPPELLDNIASIFRQQMADTAPDSMLQLELYKKYCNILSKTFDTVSVGIQADEVGNLTFTQRLKLMANQSGKDYFAKCGKTTSKWLDVYNTPGAVWAAIATRMVLPEEKAYIQESVDLSFSNVMANIGIYIDDEADLDAVKRIMESVKKVYVASVGEDKIDYVTVMTSGPVPALIGAASIRQGENVPVALKEIRDYFKKTEPEKVDKIFKLDVEKAGDYTISLIDIPKEMLSEAMESEKVQQLAAGSRELVDRLEEAAGKDDSAQSLLTQNGVALAIASSPNALLFSLSFDSKTALESVRKIAKSSTKEQALPSVRAKVSCAELGKFLAQLKIPEAKQSEAFKCAIKALSAAGPGAVITVTHEQGDQTMIQKTMIHSECFKVIGEIIRSATGQKKSDTNKEEEADSLFEN